MADKEYNKVKPNKKAVKKATEEVVVEEVEVKERKPMKQVTQAKRKKKGLVERLVLGLIGPDGLPRIGRYLNHEIVIPAVKDVIVNSIAQGVQMMVYGDSQAPVRSNRRRVDYSAAYNRPNSRRGYYSNARYRDDLPNGPVDDRGAGNYIKPRMSADFDSSEIVLPSREEAMEVFARLENAAYEYGTVTLADFYDAVGINTTSSDQAWGWKYEDLHRNAQVVMAGREGYSILLPSLERM